MTELSRENRKKRMAKGEKGIEKTEKKVPTTEYGLAVGERTGRARVRRKKKREGGELTRREVVVHARSSSAAVNWKEGEGEGFSKKGKKKRDRKAGPSLRVLSFPWPR